MDEWHQQMDGFIRLIPSDPGQAAAGIRRLFDLALSSSRNIDAMAAALTLLMLLDERQWYQEIGPFVRSQPPTCLSLMSLGMAEERLGMLAAAFESYVRALLAEKWTGDHELLEAAMAALGRVLARARERA
jgi:hypothetical protein